MKKKTHAPWFGVTMKQHFSIPKVGIAGGKLEWKQVNTLTWFYNRPFLDFVHQINVVVECMQVNNTK